MPMLERVGVARVRGRGEVEAEISKAMIRFERERMGRGPSNIRTRIVQDLVIVRMADVLSPAERALMQGGGVELLKQLRMRLLESERKSLTALLRAITGCEVVSVYGDLCPDTGEQVIMFVLAGNRETRWPPPE